MAIFLEEESGAVAENGDLHRGSKRCYRVVYVDREISRQSSSGEQIIPVQKFIDVNEHPGMLNLAHGSATFESSVVLVPDHIEEVASQRITGNPPDLTTPLLYHSPATKYWRPDSRAMWRAH